VTQDIGGAPGIAFQESNAPGEACQICGNQGQSCCTPNGGTWCASSADICFQGTCTACGGAGEPCCTPYSSCSAGNTCQDGFCGPPNVLTASPSSLTVTGNDGVRTEQPPSSASTNLVASGFWEQNEEPPSLSFCVIDAPPGVAVPPCGTDPQTYPAGIAAPVITNDVNPPTVQFAANATATEQTAGAYTFQVTGTIGVYTVTTDMTLNVLACIPNTCAESDWVCGTMDDGCGTILTCGGCPSGESCSSGSCTTCPEQNCAFNEYWNPSTCSCVPCPCGEIKIDGRWECAACKVP
jgi:hypothetical protein